jgi:large subunit ribosomal protein L35
MPKIKTRHSVSKRFSLTKSGKVKMNRSNRRHKLGIKTPKRKRQLRRNAYLSKSFERTIKSIIPKQ